MSKKRPGLWANIHAKRKRGEKMRKKGDNGAPTEAQMRQARGMVAGGVYRKAKHRGCGAVMPARRKTTKYS